MLISKSKYVEISSFNDCRQQTPALIVSLGLKIVVLWHTYMYLPSRELTHPLLRKGKSSSKMPWRGAMSAMLVLRRLHILDGRLSQFPYSVCSHRWLPSSISGRKRVCMNSNHQQPMLAAVLHRLTSHREYMGVCIQSKTSVCIQNSLPTWHVSTTISK